MTFGIYNLGSNIRMYIWMSTVFSERERNKGEKDRLQKSVLDHLCVIHRVYVDANFKMIPLEVCLIGQTYYPNFREHVKGPQFNEVFISVYCVTFSSRIKTIYKVGMG